MAVWWTSIAGVLIVAWTLREIFKDLFQPSGSGSLSSFLGRWIFQVSKHVPSTMRTAGPLCIVVVISCWALSITAGFALIYWGRFPQAFHAPSTESHEPLGRFWAVLYYSLAALTTLASGEILPVGSWIRLVTAAESLIGESIITASITWIVLIYPALGRMRALSRRAQALMRAQEETGIDLFTGNIADKLADLADSIFRVRVDFIHFPLIYYFHADTEGASLARSLSQLSDLAERASKDDKPEAVRLAAALLKIALSDTADVLTRRFVPEAKGQEPTAVFNAVRRDHLERENSQS